MSTIAAYIAEHKILPHECAYHTWRMLAGKKPGSLRVLVPPNSSTAMVEYTCPECGHSAYAEQPWKRPFSLPCASCKKRLTVPKLRAQAKREMKAGK